MPNLLWDLFAWIGIGCVLTCGAIMVLGTWVAYRANQRARS